MPDFSADGPTPLYVRVAGWIESRIKPGEVKLGMRLPPGRDLARDCGVEVGRIQVLTKALEAPRREAARAVAERARSLRAATCRGAVASTAR